MAAIFYDAVAATIPVKKLYYNPSIAGRININIDGPNPGYAKGDKVLYKAANGTSFNGPIIDVYNIPVSASWPKGGTGLGLMVGNAASLGTITGGTVAPVTTATVVVPAKTNVAAPVVSAATQLKAGATAAPPAAVAVAKGPETMWFGLSKKAWMAAGVIGIAAALLFFRKGKKK